MKTHLSFFAVFFALILSVKTVSATTYTWNGPSGGNWSSAANWLPNGHPGGADIVRVGSTGGPASSITVDIPVSISQLLVLATTNLTLSSDFNVNTATISAGLTVTGSGGTFYTNLTLTVASGGFIINSGIITVSAETIFLNAGTYINNSSGATFNANGGPEINMKSGAYIVNSGTFNIDASPVRVGNAGYITNNAGGTFTINDGGSIDFSTNAGNNGYISNAGTFYAGTSNSACTVNLDYPGATIQNSGDFYAGSTSVINLTGISTKLSNTGTFTLQSDANGSATIGNISGTGATITGTYNVQRYITGGSSVYRTYRLMSSPVYTATAGGNNIYSLNYVKLTSLLTGTNGVAGGFDQGGNPTLYLYRDNIAYSNVSFTSGNFRGISDISAAPSYSINGDGSGFDIPVGNGFMFFFRGNRSNPPAKFSPGTPAESVVMTATGTLNTGQIVVKPWFNPSSSYLDYTAVPGNSNILGFALTGNPYPSSIDWNTFNNSSPNTGIYGANVSPYVYIFDPVSKTYQTYGAVFGGIGTYPQGNIIPAGQGFFVRADTTSAQLIFNESAKTNTQATQAIGNLFLGQPGQAVVSQYLNLKLLKDSINTDAAVINFNKGSTAKYSSAKDAPYLNGSGAVSLSSMSADNVALAVFTRGLPNLMPASVPLNVNATSGGAYQLKLDKIKSIPQLYDIWLMDAYNKDSVNLKSTPVYNFTINTSNAATYGSKRFSVVIRQNAAYAVQLLNFNATKGSNQSQLVWNTQYEENYTNFTVQRSTDNGATFQVLGSIPSSGLGNYGFVDVAPVTAANQYRLKMEDLNGTVTYSNIVTLSYAELISKTIPLNRISLYPNPANSTLNLSINLNNGFSSNSSALQGGSAATVITGNSAPGTTYGIKIINVNGAVIQTATISQPNWQCDVGSLAPGTYIIRVVNNSDNSVVGTNSFIKL